MNSNEVLHLQKGTGVLLAMADGRLRAFVWGFIERVEVYEDAKYYCVALNNQKVLKNNAQDFFKKKPNGTENVWLALAKEIEACATPEEAESIALGVLL